MKRPNCSGVQPLNAAWPAAAAAAAGAGARRGAWAGRARALPPLPHVGPHEVAALAAGVTEFGKTLATEGAEGVNPGDVDAPPFAIPLGIAFTGFVALLFAASLSPGTEAAAEMQERDSGFWNKESSGRVGKKPAGKKRR